MLNQQPIIKKSIIIEKSKLLIVEGKDDCSFFNCLLNNKNITDIQIISIMGKSNLSQFLKAFKNTSGFDKVCSLAVICDADYNANSRFQSVCSALENNNLPQPRKKGEFSEKNFKEGVLKVGVFILPDNSSPGMLETLCLSTVQSKSSMKCVNYFIQCLTKLSNDKKQYNLPKNLDKARCRAFLSAMEEDTPSVGVAIEKGYWNLDSEELKPLVDFLKQL